VSRRNREELIAEVRMIGGPPEEVARRIGTSLEAISRAAYRCGDRELGRTFGNPARRVRKHHSRRTT